MEFYKTCKTLPIYNFNEILRANDLRFLSKDFDDLEDEDFKLGVEETIEARGLYREIIYEYSAITKNRHLMLSYNSDMKIKEEEFNYMIIERVLKNYEENEDENVLDILNRVGIVFKVTEEIEPQVVKAITHAKRLKTKIKLMKLKHADKFNKKAKTNLKDEVIDKLDEEAISLEISLKISYSIDTRKTSVSKWVHMWNVAGRINKPKTNKNA